MTTKKIPFEQAMARLEEILEKMNTSTITLDESLSLYEEADKLIAIGSSHLQNGEKKIEMLIKTRQGNLQADQNQKPATTTFQES